VRRSDCRAAALETRDPIPGPRAQRRRGGGVPVQDSVDCDGSGGRSGAGRRLTHHEWLADGPSDPRETMARTIVEFTSGARTILAYNAPFERGRIRELAEHLPHLRAKLASVEARLVDLLPLVRDHVYHPRLAGSFSLKSVAPVLAPGVDYGALEVAEGGEAARLLYDLLLRGDAMGERERARVRRELLRYCATDTQAAAEVHRGLARAAGG
jgi:predicted RecB family nuclease